MKQSIPTGIAVAVVLLFAVAVFGVMYMKSGPKTSPGVESDGKAPTTQESSEFKQHYNERAAKEQMRR